MLLAASLRELRALYPVAVIVICNGMEPCATLAMWGGLVLNAASQLASLDAMGTVCVLTNVTATLGLVASFAPRQLPFL